jgi:SAM-dependent methyltransferase
VTTPNSAQIDYWNGAVGQRWADEQRELDRALAPFGAAMLARAALSVGERVLDVGCGCGAISLDAADAVGASGSVVGVDVSEPMLARAKARSAERANVSYILADATNHAFERATDAIVSRFGVMFFESPVLSFANLRRALRPGGRLTFVAWRTFAENGWVRFPAEVASQFIAFDDAPDPETPGPFSFGNRARIERVLTGAGFHDIDIRAFDDDVVLSRGGVEQAVDFALMTGPTARALRSASDDARAKVRGALATAFGPIAKGDVVGLPGATWIVRCRSDERA